MRRISAFFVAATAAVALTACGSDSEPETPPEQSEVTEEQTSESESSGGSDGSGDSASGGGAGAGGAAAPAEGTYPEAEGACTAFAPTQVDEILGGPAEVSGAGSKCELVVDDKELSIYITTVSSAGYEDLAAFTEAMDGYEDSQKKVEGVGEAAYFGVMNSELTFVTGDQLITLQIVLSDTSADNNPTSDKSAEMDALTELGVTAADRAPITTE